MIELIVRKIFDIGLIAIVIAFLTPLLQRLNNFFIKKFGRVFGVIIYIFSFFVVMIFLSNQTLNIYIAKKFIEQDGIFSNDIEFAINILSSPILINNQEAQTILYSLLFAKKSSDDYKAGTILWRLTRMGSSVAAIDLGKAIDEGRIDTIEFKNRSEAVFYCFELGKCLGFDMKSDLTIYNKWKFLENIISKEVSIKANKVCTRIKDEM